ncbi:MAG: feruloyl-CoA synthase [Tetrasphaera sp.]
MDHAALFATPDVSREHRPDGSILLRATTPLGDHPPSVLHDLRRWALEAPDHLLAAEREPGNGQWQSVTYAEADAAARSIGEALLELGLTPERPLLIPSGNSVGHLLMTLGALTAGIPAVPISVAYSLLSHDHARVREVTELTTPGAVYVEDGAQFASALAAIADIDDSIPVIAKTNVPDGARSLEELRATTPTTRVEDAYAAIDAETVAKILLTSGSTGVPKGVLNTHGMWAADQRGMQHAWPFLTQEQPVIVDWLPWSHTFGGNHNVGMVITNGGSLYIDAGRPAPGLFDQTLANLAEIKPTICFNVPAGYALLVSALEGDEGLAQAFFSRLRLVFNAAAALPAAVRERLVGVSERTLGRPAVITGSWGLTETAPAVTTAHFPFTDSRCIGVPLPGTELLLVPCDEDAYEARVRGSIVTPGYLRRPDATTEAFDDEGFYRTGDAVSLIDEADPSRGVAFRGRVAEDFKLTTGTFVRVGAVRTNLLSALPVLTDAVIAGEGFDRVCALAWLNVAEATKILGREPIADGAVYADPELAAWVGKRADSDPSLGSSDRIRRLILMTTPADLDAGEITDKGYVNQRRVLALRAELVERLFAAEPDPAVIVTGGRK